MKKQITLFFLFSIFFTNSAWACPGCAGSMDNSKYQYTAYILMVFIGLVYLPFFIIYKTIWKHRKGVLPEQHNIKYNE
ncbi:MAG: hypothetical protein HN576_02515 [Bacteriovoracaceae bacterium]|jgi:hypothetical protein|nr:hypothetical protein [Bacteriovoracaceae bacterium]